MEIALFVSALSVALSIPGFIRDLKQLGSGWKPGARLVAGDLQAVTANLDNLVVHLGKLFKIHYELQRWKRLHDAFHNFINMTKEIDNEIASKIEAASIDCPRIKEKWNERPLQDFLLDMETSVISTFLNMKREEVKRDVVFAEKIRDNYTIAVTAKNKVLSCIDEFVKAKSKFDEKINMEVGQPYDERNVKQIWKYMTRRAFDIIKNADNVLINLIEILGTAYSIAEKKLTP